MPVFPMHGGHPLLVHLPLIAVPLALIGDLVAIRRPHEGWDRVALALLVLGLAGVLATVATGLLAAGRVEHSDVAHALMLKHRLGGLSALAALTALTWWRWRRGPTFAGLLAAGAVVVLLGVTADLGGNLVYRHGLGISTERLEEITTERTGHHHEPGETDADSLPGHQHH